MDEFDPKQLNSEFDFSSRLPLRSHIPKYRKEPEYYQSDEFEALGCSWIAYQQVRNGKLGFSLEAVNNCDPLLFKGNISFQFDLCVKVYTKLTCEGIGETGVLYPH
jgi:hypothetical protein